MENFLERLNSLLDDDPFSDINENLLSPNDHELLENYRVKYLADRKRIREERKTKTFEQIMEDLVQELSHKPNISSFYRTLEEPLTTTGNSIRKEVQAIEPDTSADEQDDLDHCTTWIDPSKSIGRSNENEQLKTSTYMVYPLAKSPPIPKTTRTLHRYADRSRRNTYTLENSASSEDDHHHSQPQLVNTKPEYVRLHSEGFDPQQQQHENPFQNVKDARLTFSIPQTSGRFTHQEAREILADKLPAFIKGHLIRRLLRTDHVQGLIQTLNDTRKFAVDFQTQCLQTKTKLDPDDINIIDQLIQQVQETLDEIHAIFHEYSIHEQIQMIIRHDQTQQIRARRINQRISKDFPIERPVIDPLPSSTTNRKNDNLTRQTQQRRPENVRRHVAAASNRPVQSAINKQTRPLQKTTSVQRKSRPTTSTNNNPPRSSSANNNNNPPLRLAPASPLFRNRLK